MTNEFTIREAVSDDVEDILRLNKELFDYEYENGFSKTYDLDWTYSDAGRKYFNEFVTSDNHKGWVALNENGEAVGYVIGVIENLSFRNPSIVAEIEMIYLKPEYRCSGIGRTLIENFEEWAKSKVAGIIRVGALAPNAHARKFYEKWGFSEAEIMYEKNL